MKKSSASLPGASKSPWHPAVTWFLVVLVLLTLGIRYTEPVKDGDLWWQMAYGRYMLENHTLVPDHTQFTWSPAIRDHVYCAWIAEIFLYLLYQAGGLPLLVIFRYLCPLFFILLLWRHASRHDVAGHPLVWLICLVSLLMSVSGIFIKPEIFSFVCINLAV
jgi:hypothetical protein